jgi:hypothetical protein
MTEPRPVGPWWLERQLDPAGPDFVPGETRRNVTHRDWVQLGTVGSDRRAVVDPRGLVTAHPNSWSIDWWIGADDRWHLPSREVAVRQHREGAAPVVETAMRVPGGDAVHRVYGAQMAGRDLLVVEVENKSAVPFAVALVVRPYNPLGDVEVRTIRVIGTEVVVDGSVALLLPKPAARLAIGTDDVVGDVVGGRALAPSGDDAVTSAEGTAHGAVVFPLAHTATLRVLVPLGEGSAERSVSEVAPAAQVVRGWKAQVDRSVRVELPDDRVTRVLAAARHDLLLFHSGNEVRSWPGAPLSWPSTARVLAALDQFGFHAEVAQVLESGVVDPHADGPRVGVGEADRWAGPGAMLRAFATHWQMTRASQLVDRSIGPIAKAAHRIDKRRGARRRSFFEAASYADACWCVAGLIAIAPALSAAGQPEVAEDAAVFGQRLAAAVEQRYERGPDAVSILLAGSLGVLAPDHERLIAAAEHVRGPGLVDGLVVEPGGWGLSPLATLDLAVVELLAGDARALEHLVAVAERSSPVATWPEVVHPRTHGGSRGHGHDPATTAAFCSLVRTMLAVEEPGGLRLASLVPSSWLGQDWEVHGLPTGCGRLGYAVRWHGERPALLWELHLHEDVDGARLRAPGLDPNWSTTELRGEALLAPLIGASGPSPVGGGDAEASSSFA